MVLATRHGGAWVGSQVVIQREAVGAVPCTSKQTCTWFRSLAGLVIVFFLGGRLRVHFFCVAKRNEPKKRPPDDLALRASLRFSAPEGVLRRDILVPRRTRRIPAAPLRADPTGSCDARRRQRDWKNPTTILRVLDAMSVANTRSAKSNGNRIWHPVPSVAPSTGVVCGSGPQGSGMDAARLSSGQGWPVERPPQTMRSAGHPKGAIEGGLFFGDFLLATQKKVTRSLPPEKKKIIKVNRLRNHVLVSLLATNTQPTSLRKLH
jgi:hypothetical protein